MGIGRRGYIADSDLGSRGSANRSLATMNEAAAVSEETVEMMKTRRDSSARVKILDLN